MRAGACCSITFQGARELVDDDGFGLDTVGHVQPLVPIVTGAVAVGPSPGGRIASRTAEPTA
jgi:hypothetical protein